MKCKVAIRFICTAIAVAVLTSYSCFAQQEEKFTGWDGLKREVPAWFSNAKFGIYFHWGVYSVPAFNSEWYSRAMYVPGTKPYAHHIATYGTQDKFGYKDFIPLFKAEKWNPDEWVKLFKQTGARFAGVAAEHADGFSLWNSKVNHWNSVQMGPKRDIVGEFEKAVRKENLKFLTTFHHQWLWGWYPTFNDSVDAGKAEYTSLYGPVISTAAWQHQEGAEKPDASFSQQWLAKAKEVITEYKPDMLYFDSRLEHLEENYRKDVAQTFFDKSNNGEVLLYKAQALPKEVGVRTYEKSRNKQF